MKSKYLIITIILIALITIFNGKVYAETSKLEVMNLKMYQK